MESKIVIKKRIEKEKEALLEHLRKTPIIQLACKKNATSRATYYRWRKEDPEFTKNADEALYEGTKLVNDMAESQLLSAIQDKNLSAIVFWLKHHHPLYATRVEVTARLRQDEKLTPEQEKLIDKALKLAALAPEAVKSTPKNL